MDTEESDRYRAPALDKGLDILELLSTTEEGLSQAEIAKSLDRSPNEIYRMLDRLVRRDYVRRTTGDRYELTLKLFELAHATPPVSRLVSQALPIMRRFAREAEQACHLVIQDRNVLVVVAQVDSPGYWNVSIRVGSRISMVNTGSGHVFLAYATPEERRLVLEDVADARDLPPGFEERLAKVQEQGYESMPSLQVASVTNLTVPIVGPVGTVLAVLTSPFTDRLDKHDAPDMQSVLDLLIAAGEEISKRPISGGRD
ncbi:helix-turn-helix domain-containing protein [Devosia sp. D6-9]|nr:helix-turn-helix domain-containing protein [Devosia sp. D6-9]